MEKIIPSTCIMCQGGKCGIEVLVEDGEVKKIMGNQAHPFNQGKLCLKGLAGLEQLNDPDRLLVPKRKIAEDEWEEISWEQALNSIAENMNRIKEEYGPESFLFLWGPSPPYKDLVQGLAKNYGTPNQFGHTSICDSNRRLAMQLTFNDYRPLPEFKKADYILLFGANPIGAHKWMYFLGDLNSALKRGAQLVVVDPRATESTEQAEHHLAIKPGTDGLLALGMARIIIEKELYDQEFISKHSYGFEKFKEEVMKEKYKTENVAIKTGISVATILKVTTDFANAKQQLADSWTGLDNQAQGLDAHRAVASLNALVGSVDSPGGMLFREEGKLNAPSFRSQVSSPPLHEEAGYGSLIAQYGVRGLITEAILNPQRVKAGPLLNEEQTEIYQGRGIKGAFIYFTNPILADANSEKWSKALASLDFAVGYDIYQSDTLAAFPVNSIILPDTTYLERSELTKQYFNGALLSIFQKAVAPRGKARSGYWVFTKLAQLLGYEDFKDFEPDNIEPYLKNSLDLEQVDGSRVELSELRATGIWLAQNFKEPRYHRYDRLLNAKFNFAVDEELDQALIKEFLEAGGNQTPQFKIKEESAIDKLSLISTGKLKYHTQSTTQNLALLMDKVGENKLLINSEDAEARKIKDGDQVKIKSSIGKITLKAEVSSQIRVGVVQTAHGFGHQALHLNRARSQGENVNLLIDNLSIDQISGMSLLNEMEVEVEKV